jgi:cytochrome c
MRRGDFVILVGGLVGGEKYCKTATIAAALLVVLAGAASAQDVERGQALFRKCVLCHSLGGNAQNKIGPELNGLDGRRAGSIAGFLYSHAHIQSGIIWNKNTFTQYIRDPQSMVPGTKRVFAGIKDESEAEDLWAYIKRFDASGDIRR